MMVSKIILKGRASLFDLDFLFITIVLLYVFRKYQIFSRKFSSN